MASKIKVDQIQTGDGTGTIALQNQLSGMTTASLPTITTDKLGTGAVLQVVQATYSTASQTGSGTFQDTGLTATITPSSTSSKILVLVNQPLSISSATDTARDIAFNIVRGSTSIIQGMAEIDNPGTSSFNKVPGYNGLIKLDSPSTTSATTYKTQFRVNAGSSDVYAQQHGGSSTLTLMEIAG